MLGGVGLVAAAVAVNGFQRSGQVKAASVKSGQHAEVSMAGSRYVAGPGKVEPVSEDIKVGSELSGKLKQVLVEEGDLVHRGQIVAELENADYRAAILSAEATVEQREAELRKVINGARTQERREAYATVEQNKAVMENAKAEMDRRNQLFDAGIVSREDQERYVRQYDVALANYNEAFQHHSLVDDKPREEDRAAAEAALALTKAEASEARAKYEKTLIRSPIDGVVLRKHHRSGESVSNSSTVPDPIVTIGDNSVLRVRMDVDETDVAKVKVGQPAYVTADAYGGERFQGHVIRVGKELGRKNVQTDEPTEKVDTKILETLIQLDSGADLPVGLRVDAFVHTGGNAQ
ncbi:HlyD family secretion protein [Acidisarcina polymorpha]|uniref:HlyD family secretion protein n=2 Tax=Acidisarcina polymorpha TaxID=2211140 RepID=A0A2Z5G1G9_9BACT|nr:HlyD family secretion protein [Acidisarcina polymorpha]